MFKCFGATRPPAKTEPESWDDLFAKTSTEAYLKSVNSSEGGGSEQREESTSKASSLCSDNNNTYKSNNNNVFKASEPLAVPQPTTMHNHISNDRYLTDGDRQSSKQPLTLQAAANKVAAEYDLQVAMSSMSLSDSGAGLTSASTVSPTDRGTAGFTGFRAARASAVDPVTVQPKRSIFAPRPLEESSSDEGSVAAAATRPSPPRNDASSAGVARMFSSAMRDSVRSVKDHPSPGFGAGRSAVGAAATVAMEATPRRPEVAAATKSPFDGFGTIKNTTAASKQPKSAHSSSGFGFAPSRSGFAPPDAVFEHPKSMTFVPPKAAVNGATGFGGAEVTVLEPVKTGFTGFGTTSAAVSTTGGGGGAAPSSSQERVQMDFGTLHVSGPARTLNAMKSVDATPLPSNPFTGFGTVKNTTATAPNNNPFTGFGSIKTATTPASDNPFAGFGSIKSTVAEPPKPSGSAFTGFGSNKNATAPAPVVDKFTGFGTNKQVEDVPKPSSGAFTGFKTSKPATAPVPDAPFTGFGSVKNTAAPSAPQETVRMDFGTLHVSGPASTLNAMKEKEAAVEVKKEEKRVRFAEVDEIKEVKVVEKEPKKNAPQAQIEDEDEAPDSQEETDDECDSTVDRFPWGRRPCFRTMLAGGKKLVLAEPPSGVTNYFCDQAYRSYGCTYDHVSNMFYATSPGARGRATGQVVALDGGCRNPPVTVTNELPEPAAIAVYEPGLSVCVVTNKGIFVFTRQENDKGETIGYLSRQISHKGFHRGIAATSGGGIVSFSNGIIRLFDGNVANGMEKVIAEVKYDTTINAHLFADKPNRRMEKSNCCFMDIVNNRLVMSDLQKHVISLWDIDETPQSTTINFVRAVDVAVSENPARKPPGAKGIVRTPPGTCAYASGIRLDAEGWVLCADADGRTIQIFDEQLTFVTRVEPPSQLPYISGLYIESRGHLMVCDRKSEMGGLRVYMLEAVEDTKKSVEPKKPAAAKPSFGGFAAAARQQTAGGRF